MQMAVDEADLERRLTNLESELPRARGAADEGLQVLQEHLHAVEALATSVQEQLSQLDDQRFLDMEASFHSLVHDIGTRQGADMVDDDRAQSPRSAWGLGEADLRKAVAGLEAVVEAETQRRCLLIAELHQRLATEIAEVSRQVELRVDESASRVLHEVRGQALLSARAPAGSCSTRSAEYDRLSEQILQEHKDRLLTASASRVEADRVFQTERDERARLVCELRAEWGRSTKHEREARLRQMDDLAGALQQERAEREEEAAETREELARVASVARSRLPVLGPPAAVASATAAASGAAPTEAPQEGSPSTGSLVGRIFSLLPAAEAAA